MPLMPASAQEQQRMLNRLGNELAPSRAVLGKTQDLRKRYLSKFQAWLWNERQTSLRFLLDQKPADPERIASLLVDYGKEMYSSGKSYGSYGIYAETVNSIGAARPLIKRQLTSAWDLAFAWMLDEPTQHHPAMPLAVMTALVTVALTWGWQFEAAVILMAWTGIMRIGEVLCAKRSVVSFLTAVYGRIHRHRCGLCPHRH